MAQGNAGNNAFKVLKSTGANERFGLIKRQDKEKPMAVRNGNIMAARGTNDSMNILRAQTDLHKPSPMRSEPYEQPP